MENSDSVSTWYMDNCTREDAEILLQGTPNGTFLVRKKEQGLHALSLVYNYRVHHLLIYFTDENRFGFGMTEPFRMFNCLSDLIVFYSQNSLWELNPILPTELIHPVNSNLILLMRQYSPPEFN